MKKTLKGYLMGILTMLIIMGSVNFANQGSFILRNLKVVLNGQTITMKDSENRVQSAILYNNSLYVPVRSFSKILNYDVSYNSDTEKLIVKNFDNKISNKTMVKKDGDIFVESEWSGEGIHINGEEFNTENTILSMGYKIGQKNQIYYSLGKEYSKFTAQIGLDDSSKSTGNDLLDYVKVGFYGDGHLILEESFMKNENIKDVEVDLSGISSLRIEVRHEGKNTRLDIVNGEFIK